METVFDLPVCGWKLLSFSLVDENGCRFTCFVDGNGCQFTCFVDGNGCRFTWFLLMKMVVDFPVLSMKTFILVATGQRKRGRQVRHQFKILWIFIYYISSDSVRPCELKYVFLD